ncbi:MAG: HEAT repeat domain-containing protein [Anaerolineales bacterium]|nr:HEAT repeat domain-containing protein [Anaerolineales bacterium]
MDKLQGLLKDLTSGDEARAERSVAALIELGETALPALKRLTQSSEADSRWWALRVLAQATLAPTGWLIPFLDDPAPEVRQCAALGLAQKADEAATQPLVRALSDSDPLVCNLAVNALIQIGKPAVPSLIEAVKSEPQSVRIHALRALAEIKDYRAIPVLMQVIEEDSALLGHWAKEGLERLGLDMVYLKPM